MPTTPTINDALDYIKAGWYVLPLAPSTKKPYAGSRGVDDSTNSERVLRKIWRAESNIGIDCGRSGLAGLDVDPRKGGTQSLTTITGDLGSDRFRVPTSQTPSIGSHYYFSQPTNGSIRCPKVSLKGIDIKGIGGYLVAPPSYFKGDEYEGSYSWISDGPLLPFPIEILQRYPGGRIGDPTSDPFASHRNTNLTTLAGTLFNVGFSDYRLHKMLCTANELDNAADPLPENEITHMVRSSAKWDRRFCDTTGFLQEWRNYGVTGKAFELLFVLARSANTITGEWSPNRSQLMDELGTNRTHTLYDARAVLVELGTITINEHPFYLNLSTTYKLHWPGESRAPQDGKSCPPTTWN